MPASQSVEVVNSTLAPPSTCHAFHFTISRHDSLAAVARSRLDSSLAPIPGQYNTTSIISTSEDNGTTFAHAGKRDTLRMSSTATEIQFYGITLTVWTHADQLRASALKAVKARSEGGRVGLDSLVGVALSTPATSPAKSTRTPKKKTSWNRNKSDPESGSESDVPFSSFASLAALASGHDQVLPEDAEAAYGEQSDIFWIPYAVTLGGSLTLTYSHCKVDSAVSRYPIYDTLQDYLRLSVSLFFLAVARILMDSGRGTPRMRSCTCCQTIQSC